MASPQLKITDGNEAVVLDGTAGWLSLSQPFFPQTPTTRKTAQNAPGIDGSEVLVLDYENVIESFSADLLGSTDTIRAYMGRLQRLFAHARRYQEPGILPVYVKFRPDSSESWYRSQVLNGRALWAPTTLDWGWPNAATGGMAITLIFERRFFWENDSESELALMASGDTTPGATGGKTITNHDDSGHHNWLKIGTAQVLGDVAPAVRLEMTNASGGALGKLFVSHEIEQGAINFQAAYEGESATPLSNQADANSSNGNFNRLTWNGAAETDIATWTITATENARILGRWLRAIVRFANTFAYTDLYLRFKLLSGAVTIYQTEKQVMSATNSLQEIGALPIPPRLGAGATGPLSLVLQGTRVGGAAVAIASSTNASPIKITTAAAHGLSTGMQVLIASHLVNTNANGTWTITVVDATSFTLNTSTGNGVGVATGTSTPVTVLDLDYLMLMSLSGYRKFTALSTGVAVSSAVVDDGINSYVYSLTSGVKALDLSGEGNPLRLSTDANLEQRLRFVMQRADNTAPISDTLTVRAYYRDRRLTI